MNATRSLAIGFALLQGLASATTPSPTAFRFEQVALGNAPFDDPSVIFLGFGLNGAVYDPLGRPVFFGVLQGPGYTTSDDTAFLRKSGESFEILTREGSPAPGLPGYVFLSLTRPVLPDSASDSFVFKASVRNEAESSTLNGVWEHTGVAVNLVAYENQAIAGLGGIRILGNPECYNNGRTVLSVFSSIPPYPQELWLADGGAFERIAAAGSPAPGTPHAFRSSGAPSATINRTGTVLFSWQLDAAGSPTGLWAMEDGTVTPLLVPGGAAPDFPTGVTILSGSGSINEAGHVAAWGEVAGPEIDTTNRTCVWTGPPDSLRLLARSGDPAPGTTARFESLAIGGFIDGDTVLLHAGLTGSGVVPGVNDRGLWLGSAGGLTKLMRNGDPAPGTDDDVVFSGYSIAMLAESGEVSFQTNLSGPGVLLNDDDEGVWSTAGGPLSLVLRKGRMFEVSPGVEELITGFRETRAGPFAGRPRSHQPNATILINLSLENPTSYESRAAIFEASPERGPGYALWKTGAFDPADVDTPAADPDRDFDGDGIQNLFEQIFGLDPTLRDARAGKRLGIEKGTSGEVVLTFPVVSPVPDNQLGFSASTDGVNWTPIVPSEVTVDTSTPGILSHRATFDPRQLPGTTGMIRLKASER